MYSKRPLRADEATTGIMRCDLAASGKGTGWCWTEDYLRVYQDVLITLQAVQNSLLLMQLC